MDDIKLCPIMQPIGGNLPPCLGEACAWYIRNCCVVVDIADNLAEIAMDTAVLK